MRSSAWWCAVIAALCGACGADDGRDGSISQDEYDDVARSVGGSTATASGDTGAMTDVVLIAGGQVPLGLEHGDDGHVTGSVGGVDVDYLVTCHAGGGEDAVEPGCGETTDRADVVLAWHGELDLPNLYSGVAREGVWALRGLQTAIASLDGDGAFAYDASITNQSTGKTFDYALDYAATYQDVIIDTASRAVVGGNVHFAIAAQRWIDGETIRSFSIGADVYLHADGTAVIVLDDRDRYTLQLDTGVVVRVTDPAD